ncbi:unnamed protein product [Calicophoron daubneyi]|uniref:HTH CENPB-type domain-containing protein n=1 Tax=Calicophoron daubneyi TaxID=300641 RepID=A0AAV2TZ99_CALDB
MSPRGAGKRLSESQRLDIITKLQKTNAPSKRAIAREYDVSENAIRKIWNKRTAIKERTAQMSVSKLDTSFRASSGKFQEIEDVLYHWIETMRCAKLEVPPALAIAKAKQIALSMDMNGCVFKASWQWLKNFRERRGLESMMLHGEGAKVDKNDPQLLEKLNHLSRTGTSSTTPVDSP